MRSYPTNSPQALARLVAMAVVADGEFDNRESARLDELRVFSLIGIDAAGFYQVLLELCRDLGMGGKGEHVALLAPSRLEQLAAEVDSPELQRIALSAMLVTAKADGKVSDAEQSLLRFLLNRWQINLDSLR